MAVNPIIQEVEGVLHFNNVTRDEMLKRNLGKYSQWKETLHPAIGEYYDIDYDRQLKDSTDGKGLFVYTHDGKSDYSKDIERKYFQFGEGSDENYSYRPLTYGELNPWISFQHGTYTQYLDEIFGKDIVMRHVDYINNLLSGQFIENALRQTETGVIKDINVAAALQGVITTNPNNMSGKDTMLGTIGNRMYAQTLYNGAIFNSNRIKAEIRDGENYYTKAYLTPYLVNQYGNNLANVMELSDIMKIGTNETQIREDLGKDVKILDGYDGNVADLNSPQFRILNEQIKNAIELRGVDEHTLSNTNGILPINVYTPVNRQGYVNLYKGTNAWRYNISWNDVDNFGIEDRSDDIANNQTGERIISGIDNPKSGRFSGPYFYNEYNEKEKGKIPDMQENFREPDEFNFYKDTPDDKNTLLAKTSRLFHENQLDTLIARFHTDESKYGFPEFTDTARSQFGNSHGRNLLRLDAVNNSKNNTNGYDNPYCRTWTYHHQYNQIKKLIRPFIKEDAEEAEDMSKIQAINKKYRAYRTDNSNNIISGIDSLKKHSVLQDNGFVRISPHKHKGETEGDVKKSIKDCMFSIENLAWKDVTTAKNVDNINPEQIGPNGGRIMWFPPYNLDFQEGVNVEWNQNSFIGRGEKVYTYTNTERTGTLSFSLLIDHPAVINSMTGDSYKGMGQEQDVEADILRFFAGCNLPEIPEEQEKDNTTQVKKEKPTPQVKTGSIKFKVYFPNNFSGLVNTSKESFDTIAYDSFEGFVQPELEDDRYSVTTDGFNGEYKDDYWWQYLLVGNNTCVPTDPRLFRGYEMSKDINSGLYDDKRDLFTRIGLPPCRYKQNIICNNGSKDVKKQIIDTRPGKSVENGKSGENYNIELQYACSNNLDTDNEGKKVYYQVDFDLRQILQKGSLKDNNSHGLNATFDYDTTQKKEHAENEYTFAEVMLAMLKVSKANKYKKLYERYRPYLVETCGVNETQVEKIAGIFGQVTKYTGFAFYGSADTNDQQNASMLGLRRGIVTKQMISRILNNGNNIENKRIESEKVTKKGQQKPASDISMKKQRYCEIELSYEIAESDKLSDTANNRGAANENNTGEVTFEEYLDILTRNSDFIQVACNAEGYNVAFKRNLESSFNAKEDKSYIRTLEDDYQKLYDEIQVVINNYIDLNAVVLANVISNSKNYCNKSYMDHASGEAGMSDTHFANICRKIIKSGILDKIPDDSFLQEMYTYSFGIKPRTRDYDINKPGTPDYDGPTELLFFPLREINYDKNGNERPVGADAEKYENLYYSTRLLLMENLIFLLLRKVVTAGGFSEYFYCAALLVKTTSEYKTIVKDLEDFFKNPITTTTNKVKKIAEKFYEVYFIKIEPELKKIKKQQEAEEAAKNAQQIEQNRKDTEENKAAKEQENAENKAIIAQATMNKPQKNMRYETEAEYFEKLKVTDPLLFKNLKDKFKYFNPAYHSISPEGFNARLTFLHQCTRQGQTHEMNKQKNSGNGYVQTASNLAFGRMPVCVIRIGDFIHTRAIINSLTINYASSNGIIWDLNQEGAGVQPMYANVSLGITLLGGQSLGAPISRLQNAISFNYYANAEVYDNRADVAEYEEKEGNTSSVSYKRIWTPLNDGVNGDYIDVADVLQQQAAENEKNKSNKNKQDGTHKDPTDQQTSAKFNGKQDSSEGTNPQTQAVVYSKEITDFVKNEWEMSALDFFKSDYELTISVNEEYVKSGYQRDKFSYIFKDIPCTYQFTGDISESVIDTGGVYKQLESQIYQGVLNYVNNH